MLVSIQILTTAPIMMEPLSDSPDAAPTCTALSTHTRLQHQSGPSESSDVDRLQILITGLIMVGHVKFIRRCTHLQRFIDLSEAAPLIRSRSGIWC